MSNKIVLLGAGGHANVVCDSANDRVYAFVDDAVEEFLGLEKIKNVEKGTHAIISFGAVTPKDLKRRQSVYEKYIKEGVQFVSVIHPKSIVSDKAVIGEGTLVGPGAIVNAAAKIGRNVIINSGAIIEHNVVIGESTHIAPGALILGGAKIGKYVMIGAGAVVLPNAEVADETMVKSLTRYPN